MFDNLKGMLSMVNVCSPGQHKKKKPIVIMLAMQVPLSFLEAQQVSTATLISLMGSGSTFSFDLNWH
jgi:hypothetical protein